MSRPDRPFRVSFVYPEHTAHFDYATKEARNIASANAVSRTTVTSRKPVKRGEPVCWLNVYPDGAVSAWAARATADNAAATSRLHCIPVYLPGEGAESPGQQVERLNAELEHKVAANIQLDQESRRLRAEVERLTRLNENLEFAMTDSNAQLASDTAELADLRREVERLTKQVQALKDLRATENNVLSDAYMRQVDALLAERDTAQAEVERLTAALTEARANGEAELASLRRVYAAACEWGMTPVSESRDVTMQLVRATMMHAAKFGKPQEKP